MFTCPHCSKDGITFFSKLKAGESNPAKCLNCGKYSSIKGNILGIIGGLFHLLFIVALAVAFLQSSFIPLVILGLTFIVTEFFIVKFAPLMPYTAKEVKKNKIKGLILLVIIIILIILCGVFMESPVSIK